MIIAAESGGRPLALPTLLVGRARERARLREALAAALAGRGSLVLIEGDLGSGKTALARAVGREAAERGAAVQLCQSYDLTQATPFHLWLDLFARWSPTPEQGVASGATNGILEHAFPAPAPTIPVPMQTELDQLTRFSQLRDLIVAEVQQRPLCLVLEDLQWADEASLELLRFLTRTLPTLPLLIIGTYRDDEITPQHALYRLLPFLTREGGAIRLDLAPLDDEAVQTLLWARYGLAAADEARLIATLRDRAAGNPLFIEEFLRTAEETKVLQQLHDVHGADRSWRVGETVALPLPPLLKQTLDARVARLGTDALRLLAIAATIGNDVPIDLWGQVARVDDEAILALVERAVTAKLVTETPDGKLLRFSHPLVREALYDGLSAARRRIWHLRAGELLAVAQQPSADPAAVAYHFRQAGDNRAVNWLTLAGERALHHSDWAQAAARFGEAADLLRRSGNDEPTRGMLLYRRARLCRYDDPLAGIADLREAEAIARALPDRALAVLVASTRALLRSCNGQLHWAIGEMEEALQAWGTLTDEDHRRLEAWNVGQGDLSAWGMLAATLAAVGRYQEARAIAERVIATPPQERSALDGSPRGNAHLTLGIIHTARGTLVEARTAYGRAREAYRAINHHFLVGATALRELQAVLRYAADDLATRAHLADEADEALALAFGSSGFPQHAARLPLLVIEGRWSEGRELAGGLLQLPQAIALIGPLELGAIARAQGDPAAAWAIVERHLPARHATPPGDAPFDDTLRLLHLAIGLTHDANELIAMRAWLDTLDRWLIWCDTLPGGPPGACERLLAWASYHRAMHDHLRARALAEDARAAAAAPRQPLTLLAIERLLGELDTAAGAFGAALAHLHSALDLADACAAPYERALTLLSCAELSLAQAMITPAPAAIMQHAHLALDEVRALCTPLGAHPALARAAALASRLAQVAPPPPPLTTYTAAAPAAPPQVAAPQAGAAEPSPAPGGPAAAAEWLTPREGEVLRLIAGGLSNREIAAKLFLSVRTAERHIANIYKKIGAHSKADATAFAFNNGLV